MVGVIVGSFLKIIPDPNPASVAIGDSSSSRPTPPPNESQRTGRTDLAREIDLESQEKLRDIETLASSDPGKALAKLSVFGDSELFPLALGAIARGWATADATAAAEWVSHLDSGDDQVSAAMGLIPVWAAGQPEDCLSWASSQPPGNLREVSLVELAGTWGSNSPREAFTRFLALPSESGTERGLHTIVDQWALTDPDSAIGHLTVLDKTGRRDEFLETALVSLTNQDPDFVWNQSTLFDDAARTEHVRGMALLAIAETRPHEALKLSERAGNSPLLLQAIARGWALSDAPAAQAWINGIKDPVLADSLRDSIKDRPAQADPRAGELDQ